MKLRIILFFCFVFLGFVLFEGSAEAKIYLPNASGTYSQWFSGGSTCTAIGGTPGLFSEVDEYPVNNADTDYNCVDAVTQNQSYNLENATNDSGTISGVKILANAKLVSGLPTLTLFFRLGASETIGTAQTITAPYVTYSETLAKPGGGSWSTSDITSLEAGFRSGGTGVQRVTQLYIEVTYKTETNKIKYHIIQQTGDMISGQQIDTNFNVTITDPIDDIKSSFVEIKGVANTGSATLRVSIDDGNPLPACDASRVKCYSINSIGRSASFRILYDVTNYFKEKIRVSGSPQFTLNLKNDGPQAISISSGKLVVNYTWIIPPVIAGAFRPSGYIISSTFDTQAVNGASFNSIHWLGPTLPAGTLVRLQLATSNSTLGPFNFIGGATCSATDYYIPFDQNIAAAIGCSATHNNKRYFKYKVELCSSDCTAGGSATPQVNDVIVNWSP